MAISSSARTSLGIGGSSRSYTEFTGKELKEYEERPNLSGLTRTGIGGSSLAYSPFTAKELAEIVPEVVVRKGGGFVGKAKKSDAFINLLKRDDELLLEFITNNISKLDRSIYSARF